MKIYFLFILLILHSRALIVRKAEEALSGENCHQADTLFVNGNIITMDEAMPRAAAVAVKDGKIISVAGTISRELLCSVGPMTRIVNLKGKSLIPGFIDSHTHFSMSAVAFNLDFSISPPPFGSVTNISTLLQNAKRFVADRKIGPGQRVYSEGYSDYELAEHRHPTKFELDWVST